MADGRAKNGGARSGAGRKSNQQEDEFRKLLDEAWPRESRLTMIRSLVAYASAGNTKAAGLLLAYAYGKPGDADEMKIANVVERELAGALGRLKEVLDGETYKKAISALSDSEQPRP